MYHRTHFHLINIALEFVRGGGGEGRELQLEAPVPCACPRVFFMIVYIGVSDQKISIVHCMFDISLGPYFRRRKAVPSSNETPICKKLGGKSLGDEKHILRQIQGICCCCSGRMVFSLLQYRTTLCFMRNLCCKLYFCW